VRDAVELEWAGIPAVAVVHESFTLAATATAEVSGMAGYTWVEVPYPHSPPADWSAEEVRELARLVAPAVLARLVA
jgi:hypothetical protein